MGKLFIKYLDCSKVYVCACCHSHFSQHDEVISKQFHGRHGKAYLFNKAINVITGPNEERALITGLHVVCDLYCAICKNIVGWKYEDAYEESQKYKIGKYILEKKKIKKESNFVICSEDASPPTPTATLQPSNNRGTLVLDDDDSEDESDE